MKKLTLEQALKTPNIKFRVTEEQARAVYEQSKSWTSFTTLVMGFIMRPDTSFCPIYAIEVNNFNFSNKEEIKIIEEESNTFNSQQDFNIGDVVQHHCGHIGLVIGYYPFIKGDLKSGLNVVKEDGFTFGCNIKEFTLLSKSVLPKESKYITINGFQVPKPIKELSEFKLANLLIEEGIHSNSENAYIHAQAMLGCIDL